MTPRTQPLRESARWLSPVLGAVLLLGSLVLGLHQHRGGQEHRTCAACTVGHTPAMTANAAPSLATPPARVERPLAAPALAPRWAARAITSPRAPPLG